MEKYLFSLIAFLIFSFSAKSQITTFEKAYGDSDDNFGFDIKQTSDDGYVIAGKNFANYPSFSPNDSCFLLRIKPNGDTLWVKKYSSPSFSSISSVIETAEGGFAITGFGPSYPLVTKTNSSGNILWTFSHPDSVIYYGASIIQKPDKGYIVVGYTSASSPFCCHAFTILIDSAGNYISGGVVNYIGKMTQIKQSSLDKYIIAGMGIYMSPPILQVKKIESNGSQQWSHPVYTTGAGYYNRPCFDNIPTGGYIFGGEDVNRNYKLNVVKLDSLGNFVWAKPYNSYGSDICAAYGGGFLTGTNTSNNHDNLRLMKLNSNGDSLWSVDYGGAMEEDLYHLESTNDCGIVMVGTTKSYGAGNRDIYIIKTDCNGLVTSVNNVDFSKKINVSVFPNPFNTSVTFKLNYDSFKNFDFFLYDYRGEIVKSLSIFESEFNIEKGNLPSGFYFYQIRIKNGIINSGKLIIE
jgi:hypothetical protein